MTTREQAMSALAGVVQSALGDMAFEREFDRVMEVGEGIAILRSGQLLEGESQGFIGSATYSAVRLAVLEMAFPARDTFAADQVQLETRIELICAAIAADPTLGGRCSHAEGGQSVPDPLTDDGAPTSPTVLMGIRLEYDAPLEALA